VIAPRLQNYSAVEFVEIARGEAIAPRLPPLIFPIKLLGQAQVEVMAPSDSPGTIGIKRGTSHQPLTPKDSLAKGV